MKSESMNLERQQKCKLEQKGGTGCKGMNRDELGLKTWQKGRKDMFRRHGAFILADCQ